MDAPFVHLHVHSEYSLLDSTARIRPLVKKAAELGMKAIALTDACVMYGTIPFYKACHEEGIQPIIGAELHIVNSNPAGKDKPKDRLIFSLVLLAETMEGYQNLIRLVSRAQLNGSHTPFVTKNELAEFSQGIIALSGGLDGEIGHLLREGRTEEAVQAANLYGQLFGQGNFFLELQDHEQDEQRVINQRTAVLSRETSIPLVAANDVHYIEKQEADIHDVLLCISQGKAIDDAGRVRYKTKEHYLKSPQKMEELFVFLPEALENTVRIAERCRFELPLGTPVLPHFPLPEDTEPDEYLRRLCYDGLDYRYGQYADGVKERLDYELGVIKNMGFSDYFLIVWDFIRHAKQQGIAVGPGRGSAAGSLVAYALQITDIDPVKYNLLFERFLNPERVSMPDIDVDFSYDRRDEVIAYVVNKYGTDRVAQIITFGTMAARAAVRDVGRVLGVSPQIVDRVAKMIPSEPGITLEKAVRKNTQLQQAVEENPQVEKLMQLARAVEGLPRHASTHAAGVVISREPLTHYVPLQQGHENHALTQYSMESLEDVGLLKMDFLGLRNLTLLEYAVRMIEEQEGKRIDLSRLPLDDERTYRMLADADTSGVFQLESSGMRHVLREVRPSGFEDIIAVLALFRPGPMEFIPEFAATKHGKKQITYLHPVLEPILKDTYGFILYQEQIMQIASSVAGFTLGEADILRRAVSKKKKELLQEQRDKFVAGSLRQGYDENLSNRLYDLIVRFADYGFNRSHSAAYGLIAYQMAYLKANHPVPFMASLLAISQGSIDKTAEYMEECKRRSIPVLPPDVNCSSAHFTVEGDSIRFGLGAIKNVGVQAVRAIVEERRRKPFKDLYDFCLRIDQRICNKRVLEALVLSGAMDSFPGHRAAFLAGLDEALSWSQKMRREKEQSQLGLFEENQEGANSAPVLSSDVQPFQQKEMLEQERDLLGFHLSGHPMDEYAQVCRHPSVTPLHRLGEMKDKQDVRLIGMVSAVRSISTKKGQPMAFVQLEDKMSNAEIVVFPGVYGQAAHLLKKGRLLVIEGKADCQGEDVKCIADRIKDINELKPLPVEEGSSSSRRNVFIKIEKRIEENSRQLGILQNILLRAPGACPVILYYASKKQYVRLSADHSIEPNAEMVRKIEEIVGNGQIIVKNL